MVQASVNMNTGLPSDEENRQEEQERPKVSVDQSYGPVRVAVDADGTVHQGKDRAVQSPGATPVGSQQSVVGSAKTSSGSPTNQMDNNTLVEIPVIGTTTLGAAVQMGYVQPNGQGGYEDTAFAKEWMAKHSQVASEVKQEQQQQVESELAQLRNDHPLGEDASESMDTLDQTLGQKGADNLMANIISFITDQTPADGKLFEAAQRSGIDSDTLYDEVQKVVDGFVLSAGSYLASKHGVDPDEIQEAIESQKLSKDVLRDAMLSHLHTLDPRSWDKVVDDFRKKQARGEL